MAENTIKGVGLDDGVEVTIYGLGGGGGIEEWKNYEEVDLASAFGGEDAPEGMVNWLNTNYSDGKVKVADICVPFFEMQLLGKEEPDTPQYAEEVPFWEYKNQQIEIKEGVYKGGGFIGGYLFVMKSPYWEMYMAGAMQMSDMEELYIVSGALGVALGSVTPLIVVVKTRGLWYWGVFDM